MHGVMAGREVAADGSERDASLDGAEDALGALFGDTKAGGAVDALRRQRSLLGGVRHVLGSSDLATQPHAPRLWFAFRRHLAPPTLPLNKSASCAVLAGRLCGERSFKTLTRLRIRLLALTAVQSIAQRVR